MRPAVQADLGAAVRAVVKARWRLRLAAVATSVALWLLAARPAFARSGDDGEQPGPPLPLGAALLIYVAIPLAIAAAIALLVYMPSIARGPRYRPGREWNAEPVWVNSPSEGASADASGGAAPDLADSPARRMAEGGTSARW